MRAAVITEEIHVALLQQGTNIALAVDYIGQTEHTAWSLLWRHIGLTCLLGVHCKPEYILFKYADDTYIVIPAINANSRSA